MLQQFTWHQFLIAALIFTLAWYLAIILLYYRRELVEFVSSKNKHKPPEKLRREWEEELEEDGPDDDQESVIGKPTIPEGIIEMGMNQFGFAPKERTTDEQGNQKEIQLAIIPDVLEELKNIFRVLEKENGVKEDFITLFALVTSKYPAIRDTPNLEAINDYIRENLAFDISDEELNDLWTSSQE